MSYKNVRTRVKQDHMHSVNEFATGREEDQTIANTGAVVYKISPEEQFKRFLILGSEGNRYYVSEAQLTAENAKNAMQFIAKNGQRAVEMIVEISDAGRAASNSAALFALAMASAADDVNTRRAALNVLTRVARTGTHLFEFATYAQNFRGWGKALKKAVANWYNDRDVDQLAYQLVKYRQREGWTHRDLLRLSHPRADGVRNSVYGWVVKGMESLSPEQRMEVPDMIAAFETVQSTDNKNIVIDMILDYNLPREALPTQWLNDADVWAAMLPKMPLTATIRNLGKMSNIGLLTGNNLEILEGKFSEEALHKARIHPINVLTALKTYSNGRGLKGRLTWNPDNRVKALMNDVFYRSFDFVEPTNKNFLLALDVSGSMGGIFYGMSSVLTPREISAAMAMTLVRTESNLTVVGFCNSLVDLTNKIHPTMSLETVVKNISGLPFGSTDCSAPMQWASNNKLKFDVFNVWTDNETGTGSYSWNRSARQPADALRNYRSRSGIDSKLIVCATEPVDFSIADPKDPGMLDVAGFDSNVPTIINEFVRGF